jgi:hypothetical protein
MTHPTVQRMAWHPAIVVALCGAAACGEAGLSSGSTGVLQPSSHNHPLTSVARLRGTVDVARGTLTFDPVSATGATLPSSGVSASIYGDQGVTVRIYNSAVLASAPVAGKKTYSANVGLRNLLTYRMGDEQGAAAPADTMGIYVFTNTAPIVSGTSSPCTCTVTVKNAQGMLSLTTAAKQPYWYWPEIVGAVNGGSDTTRLRKKWVFEADTQVTNFSFDVLVSAAWAPPNDTTWRIEYPGDSLPDTEAEPRWRKLSTTSATSTIVASQLTLTNSSASDSVFYYRGDSIATGMNAMVEARFRLDNGGLRSKPQVGVVLDDGVKMIGVFVSDSSKSANSAVIGFVTSSGSAAFTGPVPVTIASRTSHTVQVRKFRTDTVVVYVDGVRTLSSTYGALPATRGAANIMFGARSPGGTGNTSTWEYVVYQLGQATP